MYSSVDVHDNSTMLHQQTKPPWTVNEQYNWPFLFLAKHFVCQLHSIVCGDCQMRRLARARCCFRRALRGSQTPIAECLKHGGESMLRWLFAL